MDGQCKIYLLLLGLLNNDSNKYRDNREPVINKYDQNTIQKPK